MEQRKESENLSMVQTHNTAPRYDIGGTDHPSSSQPRNSPIGASRLVHSSSTSTYTRSLPSPQMSGIERNSTHEDLSSLSYEELASICRANWLPDHVRLSAGTRMEILKEFKDFERALNEYTHNKKADWDVYNAALWKQVSTVKDTKLEIINKAQRYGAAFDQICNVRGPGRISPNFFAPRYYEVAAPQPSVFLDLKTSRPGLGSAERAVKSCTPGEAAMEDTLAVKDIPGGHSSPAPDYVSLIDEPTSAEEVSQIRATENELTITKRNERVKSSKNVDIKIESRFCDVALEREIYMKPHVVLRERFFNVNEEVFSALALLFKSKLSEDAYIRLSASGYYIIFPGSVEGEDAAWVFFNYFISKELDGKSLPMALVSNGRIVNFSHDALEGWSNRPHFGLIEADVESGSFS